MTEHQDSVSQQKLLLEAEEWAEEVKCIHIHQRQSMWYDNRPQDTANRNVMDVQHNSGIIKRYRNNKLIHVFGSKKSGKELVDLYRRGGE